MKRGFDKERDLVDYLVFNGYAAFRVAGSGAGTPRGLPDIVAGNKKDIYAIELKSSSRNNIYVDGGQIKRLIDFSNSFGAIPILSAKFTYLHYVFLSIKDIRYNKNGNVNISRDFARCFKNRLVIPEV